MVMRAVLGIPVCGIGEIRIIAVAHVMVQVLERFEVV